MRTYDSKGHYQAGYYTVVCGLEWGRVKWCAGEPKKVTCKNCRRALSAARVTASEETERDAENKGES